MYTNDKINTGGEITSVGKQKILAPFYIILIPKKELKNSLALLDVRINHNREYDEFPFVIGAWNPVVLSDINVRQEDLNDYRIFWGKE